MPATPPRRRNACATLESVIRPGWSLGEIAFLYGLRLIVHAVAGVLAGPFFGLEWQVRSGQFDRYLVRPVSPLLQFMTQSVQVSVLGDLLGGLAIFLAATALTDVAWTLSAMAYLLLASPVERWSSWPREFSSGP